MQSLKAGAAQVDITPPLGTVINGEFRSRYANKIADRLYAKALLLKDGKTMSLIVLADTCAMRRDLLDETKSLIFQELGIHPERQLIASTHTHSGGAVEDLLMGHVDYAYRKRVPGLIAQSATAAAQVLRPAKVAWAAVDQPQHLLCRRYQMAPGYRAVNPVTGGIDAVKTNPFGDEGQIVGPTTQPDPGLGFLAVKGLDDEWIALLANYSLHYVGDCERGTISADYFGCFARELGSQLRAGDGFVGILSNGTSGEVNVWDFQQPGRYPIEAHRKSELIARDLASAVTDRLRNLQWETDASLEGALEYVRVGVRKPSADELAEAKRIVESTDYEHIAFGEPDFFKQVYAREQVLLFEYPDSTEFPVQTLRIGSGVIGALGGEFFSQTGLRLKAVSEPGKYFTITMANDYVGYVPPANELIRGGYESWRCRTSYLEAHAEEAIRIKLIQQVKAYG